MLCNFPIVLLEFGAGSSMNPENRLSVLELVDVVEDGLSFSAIIRLMLRIIRFDLPYTTKTPNCKTSMPIIRSECLIKCIPAFLLTDEQLVSRIRNHKRDILSFLIF